MSKSMKNALKVAGILVAAGIFLCIGAFALSGGDWSRFQTRGEMMTRKEYTAAAEDVSLIDIDSDIQSVSVRESSDGEIHLRYGESEYSGFDIALSPDGTLTAESYHDRNRPWYSYISFDWSDIGDNNVILELPEDYDGALSISGQTSGIELEDIELDGALSLAVLTGRVTLENVKADTVSIACTTGSMRLSNCESQSVSLAATTGGIDAEAVDCGGSISIATTSGNIDLADISADDSISASAVTGRIDLEGVYADALDLSATTGRISGTLPGSVDDYRISVSTTTGTSSLRSGGNGSIALDVKTTTGRIDIDFEN